MSEKSVILFAFSFLLLRVGGCVRVYTYIFASPALDYFVEQLAKRCIWNTVVTIYALYA